MKLLKRNKHNSITKKLFEVIEETTYQAGEYMLLVTAGQWYTVKVKHFGYSPTTIQWFGKAGIKELTKMANLK